MGRVVRHEGLHIREIPRDATKVDGKLFSPEHSVTQMAEVMNKLTPSDSGNCFAWDGKRVEF